ncbi:MAG: DUF4173 domain-containing protein [Clostridiales bacterium]|jgi:hypothetical protein|nr:DUF4173 domain-containing protein [Clostridiales bacterium]
MDTWNEGAFSFGQPDKTRLSVNTVKPVSPDRTDVVFALCAFVIGYLFSRWVFFSWQGWGVAAFTTLYCVSAAVYVCIREKSLALKGEGLFWILTCWLTGLSFALFPGRGLGPLRGLFLFCLAVYSVMSLTKTQIGGRTDNLLALDGLNLVFVIPFRNFLNQYAALMAQKNKNKSRYRAYFSVLAGIAVALLSLYVLVPLLLSADSGGFAKIMDSFSGLLNFNNTAVIRFMIYFLPSIPIAAYIYALFSGCGHNRNCDTFKKDAANKAVTTLRIIPAATVYTVLGILCGVYLAFIFSQLPYFFSAFSGKRPEGFLVYSEYARRGFFELTQLAAINLGVVTAANTMNRKRRPQSRTLKVFNVVFALLTLVFIATAFSKMALYIRVYGLTMPRILPCVFMGFMALICLAVIAMQKWTFSIIRFAAFTGALILCALFLCDPDAIVVKINADRYVNGTLSEFDTEILSRSGPAGVLPALEVYQTTGDQRLKDRLEDYLIDQRNFAMTNRNSAKYDLQSETAYRAVTEYFANRPPD